MINQLSKTVSSPKTMQQCLDDRWMVVKSPVAT